MAGHQRSRRLCLGTVAGALTRRYHGAARSPRCRRPFGRTVMFNHVWERLRWPDGRIGVAADDDRDGGGKEFDTRAVSRRRSDSKRACRSGRYDVEGVRLEKRVADAAPAEHDARHLPAAVGRAGPARAAAARRIPAARGAGQPSASPRRMRCRPSAIDSRSCPAATCRRCDCSSTGRTRRSPSCRRRSSTSSYALEAEPRLRVLRRSLDARLLPPDARAGRVRARWSRRPSRWETIGALESGGAAGAERQRPHAPDRVGAARAARPASAARARARRRSVHHHARRPRRGSGARARGGRRSAHGHRRLPLVHRLGPRHDDQPRRADAVHRPPARGGLHPAHVRPLRARRPHPEHVSRRHEGGPLPHRRRDAVVLPRDPPLRDGDRRPRDAAPAAADAEVDRRASRARHAVRHRRRSRRTACCARARRATS